MGQKITDPFTAMQYLVWAIEEIDRFDHPEASSYAREALAKLRRTQQEAEARLMVIQENQWPKLNGTSNSCGEPSAVTLPTRRS